MQTKQKRGRRSAAEWSEIVQAWKSSGETAEQFASRHGLNAGTLGWWRSQLAKEAPAPRAGSRRRATRKCSTARFAEVVVTPPATATSRLEVVTPNGHRVRVQGGVDPAELRALLQVLRSC